MEYTKLTKEEQEAIINNHIRQAEADHLNHTLNQDKYKSALKEETDNSVKEVIQKKIDEYEVIIKEAERSARVATKALDDREETSRLDK